MREQRGSLYVWLTYITLLGLPLLFFLSYFNRFAGLSSGAGEYSSGVALLRGAIPYKNAYVTSPPLSFLKSALLLKMFGMRLIVSRTAGLVERLLIAVLLFHWLRKMFQTRSSLVASVVTMILSAGDLTDPIASYNHDCIFLAMLSGFAASQALEGERGVLRLLGFSAVSGFFASLSLLTKQTIGLGEMFAIPFIVTLLLAKMDSFRRALEWLVFYLAGAVVPLAVLLLSLRHYGALQAFFQMLFVAGPAAKATHGSEFLRREVLIAFQMRGWVTVALAAITISANMVMRSLNQKEKQPEEENGIRTTATILGLGTVLLVGTKVLSYYRFHDLLASTKSIVYYTFIFLTILLASFVVDIFRTIPSRRYAQCILFCGVSWASAFMLSLSWPAFEAMLLPGFGFLLAALYEQWPTGRRKLLYAGIAIAVFLQMRDKMIAPFGFILGDEGPVRKARYASDQKQLAGIRMTLETRDFLDRTEDLIQSHTRTSDTIFTFPEMGLIYDLADRKLPTLSGSHNIDVVNDTFAREEAARLLAHPPALIIYCKPSEHQLWNDEIIWRHKQRSGQRDIVAALDELASTYVLAGAYPIEPNGPVAKVYLRPDRQ